MDIVCFDEDGEVGAVVDDERDAEPASHVPGLFQGPKQLAVRHRLLTELDDVDASANRRLDHSANRSRAAVIR